MIDIDEVEAGGFLAELDLTGSGLADLDLFPLQDVGTAGLMDSDRVGHGGLQALPAAKEKPRFERTEGGSPFNPDGDRLVGAARQRREQ